MSDPNQAYLLNHLWLPVSSLEPNRLRLIMASLVASDGTGDHPLYHYSDKEPHILLPRTFLHRVRELGYTGSVIDQRPTSFEEVDYQSVIELDTRWVAGRSTPTGLTLQRDAAEALRKTDLGGVIQLYCGAGKTVVALDAIAKERKPVLIVTDNLELMRQWQASFHRFLGVPYSLMAVAKTDVAPYRTAPVVFTTYASLASIYRGKNNSGPGVFAEVQQRFHRVFFDEAHHVSATHYAQCAEAITGGRIALTATPKRADGLHVIQEQHIGPILYKNLRAPLKSKVRFLKTGFSLVRDPKDMKEVREGHELAKLAGYLGSQEERIQLLRQALEDLLLEGRKVLVLSASVTALANLAAACARIPERVANEQRGDLLTRVLGLRPDFGALTAEVDLEDRNPKARCVFAVRKFGREGYDDEALDTVLLLEPLKDEGLIMQILGRPTRSFSGKKEPLVVVAEDNIHALLQRARAMRQALRSWPEEAGGRVEFT